MNNERLYNLIKYAFEAGHMTGKAEKDPQGDRVSMRRAIQIFGRAWIEKKMEEGKITAHRSSDTPNAKYFLSMAEMRCVKNNEAICEIVVKDKYNIND